MTLYSAFAEFLSYNPSYGYTRTATSHRLGTAVCGQQEVFSSSPQSYR